MSVLTKSPWTRRARRIGFGGALAFAVLAAFIPAGVQAQDDEDDKKSWWNLDKKLLNDFMRGLGLRNGSEPQIEYRERLRQCVRRQPAPAGEDCGWADALPPGRSTRTSSASKKRLPSARTARATIRTMRAAI